MNMMSKRLCAVSASALLAVSMAIPASAATPWTPAAGASAQPQAVQVQYRRHHGHHRFEMRQGRPYYHGHRGYRHYRHGYRQYNGYWFPPAAFIAGAIIGGAMASPAPRHGGSAHVRWCEQHYRSYDPRTDTYQPYHGPRKRCVSPY